jgi:hypothetical protein
MTNRYTQLETNISEIYAGAWDNIFRTFSENTLLRVNYLLKSQDKYLIIKEIDRARGAYISWLYICPEWSLLADCFNLWQLQSSIGNPPDPLNLFQTAFSSCSYALDSMLIYDQIENVCFFPNAHRALTNGVDVVSLCIRLDFGAHAVKSDLERHLYSDFAWLSQQEVIGMDVDTSIHMWIK